MGGRGGAGGRDEAARGEEGKMGEDTGVPGVGVLDWLEYPLEGEARRCSTPAEAGVGSGVGLYPSLSSTSEPGDGGGKSQAWKPPGLGERFLEGVGAAGSKGSKVVIVPQLTALWRLLGLLRGTQGSW